MRIQTASSKMISQSAMPTDAPGDAHTHLRGRWLLLARVAWLAVVALTVGLYVFSIPTKDLSAIFFTAIDVMFVLVYVNVALVIFWRKSDDWMAILGSLMLVTFSATFSDSLALAAASYPALNLVSGFISQVGTASLLLFFYLFPDGRFVPRWTRWIALIVFGLGVVGAFFPDSPFGGNGPGIFIGLGSILFVQIYRYWKVSGTVERQQTKWVVFGMTVAFGGFLALILFLNLLGINPESNQVPSVVVGMALFAAFHLCLALIPLSLMVAILRYRLWEIDVLINRTLVYAPLTAILAGIFAASITLSQKFFVAVTGQSSDAATVLTTLIVVAAFDPLKIGLQHLVDLRFKEARDPTKQLKAYGDQVDAVVHILRADQSARRLLDEAMKAFDARSGAVFLMRDDALQMVQQRGDSSDEYKLSVPLANDGRQLGALSLGSRHNGLDYTVDERATLQQIANSVAAAIALTERLDGESH